MCLYPKLIRNRKYVVNDKNGGDVPVPIDSRVLFVPVGCGKCIECRRKKSREWKVRLLEDIKVHKNAKFVTLTFSKDSINELGSLFNSYGYDKDNDICTIAVRRFLEVWRKHNKKSVRHWLINEIGGNRYEGVHLHGLIWGDSDEIKKRWRYGFVFIGDKVNEGTINYISKYVTKIDKKHSEFVSKVFCSKGIGNGFFDRKDLDFFRKNDCYMLSNGSKISLPIYYRNYLYNEDTREKLWVDLLNKNIRYVDKVKVDISNGLDDYYKILESSRKKNKRLGYGDDAKDWSKIKYENDRREMMNKAKGLV